MDYDYRLQIIKMQLNNLFSSYAVPVQFRNVPDWKDNEVKIIARTVNQLFPNDATREMIEGTFGRAELKIKAAHKSRTMPSGADIATAIKHSIAVTDDLPSVSPDWLPDANIINANRIKRGEPVSEYYVTGNKADELVHEGLITERDLQPYREYLAVEKLDKV